MAKKRSKNWNNFLLLAGLTVATVASYFLVTDKKAFPKNNTPGPSPPGPPKPCLANSSEFPLQLGSGYSARTNARCEAEYVTKVQTTINKFLVNPKFGLDLLSVDGKYGSKTQAAVHRLWGVNYVNKTLYDNMSNYNF